MPLADARPVAMIATADRKAAEPFYAGTLGLRSLGDDGFAALFDLAGTTLRLTQVPGYCAAPHPVLGWEVPDMDSAVAALAARGVVMNVYEGLGQDERGIWTAPDGSCKVAFFSDPDGNGLSLTQRL
ncbi:MAG TPA: VOC family protein [Allosphingosinicella sp.]|jgi:catechol 2,3-dioxygenase-like lactoylglutathione lyase family enzyme